MQSDGTLEEDKFGAIEIVRLFGPTPFSAQNGNETINQRRNGNS